MPPGLHGHEYARFREAFNASLDQFFNERYPMHDVTKSSNPDVQALLVVITGLAARVEALEAQIAALPDAFVVPGPNGEVPAGTEASANAASEG